MERTAEPNRVGTLSQLLGGFLAVTFFFVASNVYSELQARDVGGSALQIAHETSPSIERLASARGDLRILESLLAREVRSRSASPAELNEIARARAHLGAMSALALIGTRPGAAADLGGAFESALSGFDEVAARVRASLDDGAARMPSVEEVHAQADGVDARAQQWIESQAKSTHDLARVIETARARGVRTAFVLDAISVLLAAVTALLAVRVVVRFERLIAQHRTLAERRAEELEEFAGRVAHDIRGPLSTVGLTLDTAARGDGDTAATAVALQRARKSLARVNGIIEGLLEFARSGARPSLGSRTQVGDVLNGLSDELEPVARAADVDLRIESPRDTAVVCSQGVLASIVGNLLRNAIKFMGASVERSVKLRVIDKEHVVRFEVSDTGPGMSSETARRAFEPYVRAPEATQPGIGLGLATVRRLVRAHNGNVGVDSRVGHGSTFWFELPKPRDPPPSVHGAIAQEHGT